jgi:hypothetical protein
MEGLIVRKINFGVNLGFNWVQPCFMLVGISAQPTRLGWVQPCGWANTGPAQPSPFYFIYYLFFSLFLCVFFIIYLYFFKIFLFSHGFVYAI